VTKLLVVGCGFPQLSLVRAAKQLGLSVVGADVNPRAVAVPHCDEFFRISTHDVDGLCELAAGSRVDAVATSGSEVSLSSTAVVAARLGFPFYADPETVRRCQDKDVMRAAYAAAGLAIPAFARCESLEEARAFAKRSGYPLVVKPSRGSGQRGVARVEDDAELDAAFDVARSYSASVGLPLVVVEQWIEGREFSVNAWIGHDPGAGGRFASYCVTERITVPGKSPLGVMIAEVYPSGLSPEDEARVVDEARRGAAALGHKRGPCYSQVALCPSGCFLFETAARLGGGFDADVTRLASGVDLYRRVLGVALNERALEQQGSVTRAHASAIAKFQVVRPGRVNAVVGLEDARALAGVEDAQCFVPVGGRVLPLTDSAKRAAYVLVHGSTRGEAMARADAALAKISVDTRDDARSEDEHRSEVTV